LWDFIENDESEVIKKLNLIKFLIIDEADRMVELGHFP
jgi:ATP-dependent RNA helicase DDX24/MAK5